MSERHTKGNEGAALNRENAVVERRTTYVAHIVEGPRLLGDLSPVGLEKAGIADQTQPRIDGLAAGNTTHSLFPLCPIKYRN